MPTGPVNRDSLPGAPMASLAAPTPHDRSLPSTCSEPGGMLALIPKVQLQGSRGLHLTDDKTEAGQESGSHWGNMLHQWGPQSP